MLISFQSSYLFMSYKCQRRYFMQIFVDPVERLNSPVYFAPPCMYCEVCLVRIPGPRLAHVREPRHSDAFTFICVYVHCYLF